MKGKRYRKTKGIISRNIGGEILLVPVIRTPKGLKRIYSLSGNVEKRIWALINSKNSQEDIRETLIREYDADPGRIGADLGRFMKKLSKEGIIEETKT